MNNIKVGIGTLICVTLGSPKFKVPVAWVMKCYLELGRLSHYIPGNANITLLSLLIHVTVLLTWERNPSLDG